MAIEPEAESLTRSTVVVSAAAKQGSLVSRLPYAEFSLGLSRKGVGHRAPLSGAIEVTHRCPNRCVHCYNNLELGHREASLGELDYVTHCRILDEIVDAGCLWLLYTGGEIFARNDFLDIYTYAKQKGLLVTLFTSGFSLDERSADHLAQWRPFSLEITLYGRTRATHERVTRVAGSYERTMRAIRLLRERNLPLKLKTVVMTLNRHELRDLKGFAEEELGLPFRFDAMLTPRADCSRAPLAFRLSPQEIVELDLEDPSRVAAWQEFAEGCGRAAPAAEQRDLFRCGAGISAFDIDPYGNLRLCGLLPQAGWDVRSGSFEKGWQTFIAEARQQRIGRRTKCTDCDIRALCGMCPANGALENHDAEEPVDFLCDVAHLRARALGIRRAPYRECRHRATA